MTDSTFRDNGLFWISDSKPVQSHSSEDQRVAGVLDVGQDGGVTLELIGRLSKLLPHEVILGATQSSSHLVRGVLTKTGKHVLLTGAVVKSARQNGVISSETMIADAVLLSDEMVDLDQFTELRISLRGFEAWVSQGSVTAQRSTVSEIGDSSLTLKLECEADRTYETMLGSISIQADVAGHLPSWDSTSVDNSIQSEMLLSPTGQLSFARLLDYFRGFQDLILVLSGSTRSLPWPSAAHAQTSGLVKIFFRRMGQDDSELTRNSCWLDLTRLGADFGQIVDRWFERRRELGPGLHLFLGTRRPRQMYLEHKFANLTWGLESLHRRIHGERTDTPSPLTAKFTRIIDSLSTATWHSKSDRKFAERRFQNPEPSLAERIDELVSGIGLGFDATKLREFSENCAGLRNDLAHYGGEREPGTYSDVIENYLIYTTALNHLYHLLLLSLLGVAPQHIIWIVQKHPAGVRRALAAAGLHANIPTLRPDTASNRERDA